MRSFVAVELSDDCRAPLVRILRALPRQRDVRWCTTDQLHVTLKFLGEVDDARLPPVIDVVERISAAGAPFTIRLGRLGAFPSPRSPRVLWCGLEDPAGGCARWVQAADPLFEALGFPREDRAYTAHITLGRSKGPAGSAALAQALAAAGPVPPLELLVDHVVLFESRLRPSGAEYVPTARARLGPA